MPINPLRLRQLRVLAGVVSAVSWLVLTRLPLRRVPRRSRSRALSSSSNPRKTSPYKRVKPQLVGNFTLQFNLTVYNNTGQDGVQPQLFVITANSGFFESIRGSSRIIKGVLSEQDIIGAPLAPTATRQELHRYVGGAGLMSSLGNILSKVKGPALELLKKVGMEAGQELLSHGTAYAKKKLGLGGAMSGGEVSGGAMSGGRTRKGLDARLM